MREKARKELAKRENNETSETSDKIKTEEEKVPSFFSGMFIIFLGSTTFSIFYVSGLTLFGFLASAPFIFIGMQRISRNQAARNKPSTLDTKLN